MSRLSVESGLRALVAEMINPSTEMAAPTRADYFNRRKELQAVKGMLQKIAENSYSVGEKETTEYLIEIVDNLIKDAGERGLGLR